MSTWRVLSDSDDDAILSDMTHLSDVIGSGALMMMMMMLTVLGLLSRANTYTSAIFQYDDIT